MKFEELNLTEPILRAIENLGFNEPTEIQIKTIPLISEGRDIVGQSKTGSGKTFAFAIPAVQRTILNTKFPQTIVLCPTRELAVQITKEFRKITFYMKEVSVVPVYGGVNIEKQVQAIRNAKIVVGTPGRVLDHLNRKTLKLHAINLVVLDEADEMLNMGFRPDIESILKMTPKTRQTVMFSATIPSSIRSLTLNYMTDPVFIESETLVTSNEEIDETYIRTVRGGKKQALLELINKLKAQSMIVFCNTKRMTDSVARFLAEKGINAKPLHGDMGQADRRKTMDAMRERRIKILIATDVAARGIDISDVEYIVNFDIPNDTESYTHRIGRTGRAGKSGTSIAIIDAADQLTALFKIRDERNVQMTEHKLSQEISTFSDIIVKPAPPKSALSSGGQYRSKSKSNAFIPFTRRRR
jgi:ATP-dependent RNA helicase DeaD